VVCFGYTNASAQTYYTQIYDGGMEASQQFSSHCVGSDSSLLSISQSGASETILVKVDKTGAVLWSKSVRNPPGKPFIGGVGLPDSSFILCGMIEAPTGAIRHWINLIKISTDGQVIWSKTLNAYMDYFPTAIRYHNNKIHITGTCVTDNNFSQIFYTQTDTSGNLLTFDARKRDNEEEITTIGFIDDWTMLGGSGQFNDKEQPVMIAIDPGGNIRYFYHIETSDTGVLTDLVATASGMAACGYFDNGKCFVFHIDRPIIQTIDFDVIPLDKGSQYQHIATDNQGGIWVTGGIKNIPSSFVFKPLLSKWDVTGNHQWTYTYNQTNWTKYFNEIYVLKNELLIAGNEQLGHYYGFAAMRCNSNGYGACDPTTIERTVDHYQAAIVTYVPESLILRVENGFANTVFSELVVSNRTTCVQTVPTAGFIVTDDTICINTCVELEDQSLMGSEWNWSFENGNLNVFNGKTPPTICFDQSGTHRIRQIVSNTIGSDTFEKSIFVVDQCFSYIHVPNAFSPNNDGINDVFRPTHHAIGNYQMSVYSTYGELIFDQTGEQIAWEGKYKGINCANGWYFFRIQFQEAIDDEKEISGAVYLIR